MKRREGEGRRTSGGVGRADEGEHLAPQPRIRVTKACKFRLIVEVDASGEGTGASEGRDKDERIGRLHGE